MFPKTIDPKKVRGICSPSQTLLTFCNSGQQEVGEECEEVAPDEKGSFHQQQKKGFQGKCFRKGVGGFKSSSLEFELSQFGHFFSTHPRPTITLTPP